MLLEEERVGCYVESRSTQALLSAPFALLVPDDRSNTPTACLDGPMKCMP